jgi:hypothetical protein
MEATGDDPHPHHDHPRRRAGRGDLAAAGRAQRAHRGPGVLPRHRRVGRRRPGPVGTVGGALPGQRQRRVPQEGPVPAQVTHGPTHPGTAAGAAGAGVLGRDRAGPHRRAARRRRTHPARCTVHHRGPGAAPHGAQDRDHRPRLGRAPRRRTTPRPDLRRTPRLLDLGHGGGAAPHRGPHRGADRAGAPQPDPIPAAGHQRADPAAADRPVQDRRRAAVGDLTRARRRAVRRRRPDPRRPDPRAAGGLLRQERTRLQPAHAAAVPMAPATGNPPGRRDLAAQIPRPRADRTRRQRRRRAPDALHLPRLPQAVHHRRDHARHAAAHRPTRRRSLCG